MGDQFQLLFYVQKEKLKIFLIDSKMIVFSKQNEYGQSEEYFQLTPENKNISNLTGTNERYR